MIDWLRTFSSQDVFLDVGANVGLYTVPAVLQSCKTYAVELDLLNCAVFQENVWLNKVTNLVTMFPWALGNAEGLTQGYYREFSPWEAMLFKVWHNLASWIHDSCPGLIR